MTTSFGSTSPSSKAVETIREARQSDAGSNVSIPQPVPLEGPLTEIHLDVALAGHWPPRDQFGRGTCVAFATLAAVELLRARGPDLEPERLSEAFFHETMLQKHALSAEAQKTVPEGGVLLLQAWQALTKTGYVGAEHMPYKPSFSEKDLTPELWPEALALAETNRSQPIAYGTIGTREYADIEGAKEIAPGTDTASIVHTYLRAEQPVVVGLPLFQHPSGLSNWTLPSALQSGVILCPEDPGAPALDGPKPDGHVVCITGFIPDETESMGGWFVFRNSWGLEFGSHTTIPSNAIGPRRRGYGLLSAMHVNLYCWEYLVPHVETEMKVA